jgi:transcription elongation factor Elf1
MESDHFDCPRCGAGNWVTKLYDGRAFICSHCKLEVILRLRFVAERR